MVLLVADLKLTLAVAIGVVIVSHVTVLFFKEPLDKSEGDRDNYVDWSFFWSMLDAGYLLETR